MKNHDAPMPRSYGQYCPVALGSEILGERWSILIIMALLDGVTRFSDFQRALPRLTPGILSKRLRTLEAAGVLTTRKLRKKSPSDRGRGVEYVLTEAGLDLEPVIMMIGAWGHKWARDMTVDDLDPLHLAWSIHLRLDVDAMPSVRTVIQFVFADAPSDCRRFWIVKTADGRVDMCIRDPGFDVDVTVRSPLRRFVEAWRGFRSLEQEIAAGRIRLEGPAALRRQFPEWLLLSMLSPHPRLRPGRERRVALRAGTTASP